MTDTITTKKKILLIDDDKFLLDMYVLKFGKANYEVQSSDSTEKALKILRDGYQPSVMLVDIVMPEMDGFGFLNILRKEKLAEKAVVIMLTNQGTSEDVAKSQDLGVDGYIIKATTIPSEVLTEVEKICGSVKSK